MAHKVTHLRSASLLRASVKQKSGKHCILGIDQVSPKIPPFRSIYIQLCFTAPPAISTENIPIFTISIENLIISWKGGTEVKGESVLIYNYVFSNRG